MKNIFLVLASLLSFQSIALAQVCHSQLIQVGTKQDELFTIEDTPTDRVGAKNKMLVSGIYQFVRKGDKWDVYRCAKANSFPPVYDSKSCVIKNDFQFGSFVAKDEKGNNLQKVSDRGAATLGIVRPSAVELNEYHIEFDTDAVKVTEFNVSARTKNNSVKCPYAAAVAPTAAEMAGPRKAGFPQTPAKKVGISN